VRKKFLILIILLNQLVIPLFGLTELSGHRSVVQGTDSLVNQKKLKAEIIVIGDEILIGQIVDTNSSWIAEHLNMHGIEVRQITAVHDEPEHMMEALRRAEGRVDLVITTGGLGPTIDDITKSVLCTYFNTKLVFHEPTLQNIKELVNKRGMVMNIYNQNQALIPEICTPLPNKAGTAPGIWIERNNTIFISLPGVPHEMKHIMTNSVLPYLEKYDKINSIYHKTILTQGLPESALSEKLKEWESTLPKNIKLAYLPDPYSVRLRLSAMGPDKNILEKQVEEEIGKLKKYIPDNIYGYNNETLAEVVVRLLIMKNKTLSVVENGTGGFISHLITSVKGSDTYYKGGVTVSSSELSQKLLGVDVNLPNQNREDSEMVLREMINGAKKLFGTDYVVATLGVTGSVSSTEDSSSGIIWIAVAGPDTVVIEKMMTGDNSERNTVKSAQTALQLLRRTLIK
jgi:nicotinamide-nucleotide amidase